MRQIKVGFLSPFSTIYPNLGHEIMDGILSGIPQTLQRQFQFFPEFIQQGQPSALRAAIEKLIAFHNVDIITGMVNYRSIRDVYSLINRFKKPCLFIDLGEYLPLLSDHSPYVFYNSYEMWQLEFALGYWAQSEFGGSGSVIMPSYEAGYHLPSAFRMGTQFKKPSEMQWVLIPFRGGQNNIKDSVREYIRIIKKEQPDFLHAMFSGTEALDFFEAFKEEGLEGEIPLVATPHMVSYEVLNKVKSLNLTMYGASVWHYDADNAENQTFKKVHLSQTGGMANKFSLLGYEVGRALDNLYPFLIKGTDDTLSQLHLMKISSPRGERRFVNNNSFPNHNIDIEKIHLTGKDIKRIIIGEGKGIRSSHSIFESVYSENVSGWLNNYLCV